MQRFPQNLPPSACQTSVGASTQKRHCHDASPLETTADDDGLEDDEEVIICKATRVPINRATGRIMSVNVSTVPLTTLLDEANVLTSIWPNHQLEQC